LDLFGGHSVPATVTLTNVTVADNSAGLGAGVFNGGESTLTLANTIIGEDTGPEVSNGGSAGTVVIGSIIAVQGQNLVQGGLAGFPAVLSADPLLGPLQNNGGPTPTMALLPGSPAIDAGDNSFALDLSGNPLTTDQRGLPRIRGAAVDLGAYEGRQVTLNVTPYDVSYDGNAHTATGTATGIGGVDLRADLILTGTTHTNASTYTDTWTFHDPSGVYADESGTVSDVISPANAHPSVTGYGIPYDGNAHTAVASATDVNGNPLPASDFDLTSTVHTSAGSYMDVWSFHDPSGNYQDANGTVSDSISPANAHPSVTGYSGVPFNGAAYTAFASATDVNGNPLPTSDFNLSATMHTSAGSWTDAWSFHDPSGNYQDASGTVSDSISPANAHPSVTGYSVKYDSNAHKAAASATDVNGNPLPAGDDFVLDATVHTHAGTYTDAWSFHDPSGNYQDASGTVSDTISPANAHPTVTGYGIRYDGNAHTAVGMAIGVNNNLLPASDFVLTATMHTNPGTYTDLWTFHDPSGNYQDASGSVSDSISAPLASITGPTIGVPGQPLTYTFAVGDPVAGSYVFTINYGDGTSVTTSAGGPSMKLDHLYKATGTFTIQVKATDKNGVVSQVASRAVTISTVAMEADSSGGTALAIGGSAAGSQTIIVSATNTAGTALNVNINGKSLGTFTPTGHLFVYAQGGKNKITLQPYVARGQNYYIKVPAILYGEGTGGDHISAAGSAANNVLTGRGKNEVLTGGQGRDLLIAGTGAATLNAGAQDDILIGGWTNYDLGSTGMTYDQKLTALEAIMTEWGSTDLYLTRLSDLGSLLNTSTVHDNIANGVDIADQLNGNMSANDWFFAGLNDTITGKNVNDKTVTIK
jgi:hypothetical protein